jgi:NAD(P)-dependent dehydrogenase (short-subunit alcohol dehydrogenase family)
MGRVDGKVAIVTGSARGMGEAEARLFALEGAKVVLVDRLVDLVQESAENIRKLGGDVLALGLDVSIKSNWEIIVSKTLEAYGKIDILVNNAGIGGQPGVSVLNFDQAAFDETLATNTYGMIYGMNAVIPELKKAGGGAILNCASISAISAMGGDIPYTLSKSAILGLGRAAAKTYAPDNIRVNTLCPGIIDTPLIPFIKDENFPVTQLWKAKTKLPRFGQPEDAAYACLYLASDEGSFVTGTELIFDGGFTID